MNKHLLRTVLRGARPGQTMTEYAMIAAVIAVVCFGLYQTLGTQTSSFVQTVINLF